VIEGVVWNLVREVVELQLLIGKVGAAVGVFTEKGVDSCVCRGGAFRSLGALDFPFLDGIVDNADLKRAIKPMET
jgi:hypothetical protein